MKAVDVEYIVVHCSDSPQGRGDNAETIHRWHLEKGWDGIGYHRVVLENGAVEHGRPLYWVGAHASGINSKSVGICLIGDGAFTLQQWSALRGLILDLLKKFPRAKVVGHNYFDSNKDCPCFDVGAWWAD